MEQFPFIGHLSREKSKAAIVQQHLLKVQRIMVLICTYRLLVLMRSHKLCSRGYFGKEQGVGKEIQMTEHLSQRDPTL
jgi:hypothetical protein